MRRGLFAMAMAVAMAVTVLASSSAHAKDRPRDLGSIPTDGFTAQATLPERQKRVIRELACGMEAKFMDLTRDLANARPREILNAKAAVMAGLLDPQVLQCELTQALDPGEWDASVEYIRHRNAAHSRIWLTMAAIETSGLRS